MHYTQTGPCLALVVFLATRWKSLRKQFLILVYFVLQATVTLFKFSIISLKAQKAYLLLNIIKMQSHSHS